MISRLGTKFSKDWRKFSLSCIIFYLLSFHPAPGRQIDLSRGRSFVVKTCIEHSSSAKLWDSAMRPGLENFTNRPESSTDTTMKSNSKAKTEDNRQWQTDIKRNIMAWPIEERRLANHSYFISHFSQKRCIYGNRQDKYSQFAKRSFVSNLSWGLVKEIRILLFIRTKFLCSKTIAYRQSCKRSLFRTA